MGRYVFCMTELNGNMVVYTLVEKEEEEVVELQAGKLDNSAHCLTCLPAPPERSTGRLEKRSLQPFENRDNA